MTAARKDSDWGESATPNHENRADTVYRYHYYDIQSVLYYSIEGQNTETRLHQ